ncbi:MAG: uL13 family ribosomal protein, partial [Eubacterium sp.]|nr:uL13 family ribosomal protein [Eubacterium sp.]
KEVKYGTLMKEKSDFAMKLAVKGMIPDTTQGRKQLTRVHIYKGAEHKHEAQKPEAYEI